MSECRQIAFKGMDFLLFVSCHRDTIVGDEYGESLAYLPVREKRFHKNRFSNLEDQYLTK